MHNIKYDRYYRPQSSRARRSVRRFKPGTASPAARHLRSEHPRDVAFLRALPRSCVPDSVQRGGKTLWSCPHKDRSCGYNFTIRSSQSRVTADSSAFIERSVHVGSDQRVGNSRSYLGVCDSVRYAEKDFPSLLLGESMKIKYLALGPAAMGYFALLGKMHQLKESKELENLSEISGASAGAILALLYSIFDGDTKELLDFSMDQEISSKTKLNIQTLFNNFGLIDTTEIKDVIKETIKQKIDLENPTFAEFDAKVNIKIHISDYCLENSETQYFSSDATPEIRVVDAIMASIAVPFLFSAAKIKDKLYVDGGLCESAPMAPFLSKRGEEVQAITIMSRREMNEINDIKSFTQKIVNSILKNRIKYENIKTSKIDLRNYDIFDFKAKDTDRLEMFVKGFLTI